MKQTALRPEQAAKYLGVTSRCLQDWRVRKVGPAYVKAGDQRRGTVLYRRSDLDAFLEAHLVDRSQPTANQ